VDVHVHGGYDLRRHIRGLGQCSGMTPEQVVQNQAVAVTHAFARTARFRLQRSLRLVQHSRWCGPLILIAWAVGHFVFGAW
jgi:hypothetical protein